MTNTGEIEEVSKFTIKIERIKNPNILYGYILESLAKTIYSGFLYLTAEDAFIGAAHAYNENKGDI